MAPPLLTKRNMTTHRRIRPPGILLAVLTLVALPLAAQTTEERAGAPEGTEAVFRGRERVTAIDLVVAFEPTVGRKLVSNRRLPAKPRPEDFTVLYGGRPQTVVAVEDTGGALDNAEGEPWEMVIYLDAALTNRRGLRWAAATLAERLAELTAYGSVEVVLADPFPRTLLAATRDRVALHAELSRIAQLAEGRDELVALRYAVLKELEESDDPAALAERAAGEERRIVRRQLDALLAWLTADERRGGSTGSGRRALFLANAGWDLEPQDFYAAAVVQRSDPAATGGPAQVGGDDRLAAASEELARTVAAYGWVVFDLALPPPEPPPRGIRLGKWFLRPAAPMIFVPDEEYGINEPADRTTERHRLRREIEGFLGGIFGAYQEHRQPAKAEAYLELGRALAGQDKLADAEDALRQAVYHFADDPKTAARQAEALIELGRVLDRRGRQQEARSAFETAYVFDGERTAAELGPTFALVDSLAPLTALTRATTGSVVRDAEALDAAVASLAWRLRITYQVPGPPDEELREVSVAADFPDFRLRAPGWGRSATPDAVAAARVRRLLAAAGRPDDPPRGDVGLGVDLRRLAGAGELEVRLPLPDPDLWEETERPAVRVSLGFGGPESEEIVVEHRRGAGTVDGRRWTATLEVPLAGEEPWLAVVVEDLETGSWGARLVELEEDF